MDDVSIPVLKKTLRCCHGVSLKSISYLSARGFFAIAKRLVHTSLQVPRGISPTGAAKRCLLDLLEMENRRETPATPPSRGRRDVLHIAPGAPKRRLGSLEREPNAQRRTLSLDCDPDMGFFHEETRFFHKETPLAKRARLW